MPRPTPAIRRWQATLIVSVIGLAVAGAAVAGWWYARESTGHQGPIVLISVDGLRPSQLQAYGGEVAVPAIDALSADAVVFERAYAHSPLTLPEYASILAGQLPFEHGVRDEAGFTLKDDTRSLAELLRNRGFDTGAAVSSFLLRPESGVAQGFSFFDAALPEDRSGDTPVVERDGARTVEAAERWLRSRRGHRFFLFMQVSEEGAEPAVTRLVDQLKDRDLYDRATIVLTADSGDAPAGVSLDESALQVPLLIKQPEREGAGRRITTPVQHIDILPTVLDLVRAPLPSGLRGRSLRPVLDGDLEGFDARPIYAETLVGLFRFGGPPKFSLATSEHRYIRSGREELVDLERGRVISPLPDTADAVELREALEGLLQGHQVLPPREISAAEEDAFAALGYLPGVPLVGAHPEPLEPDQESWVVETHRTAAMLTAQKRYGAACARLAEITKTFPRMAVVHYQLGTLLGRLGRYSDAERAFRAAAASEPDNPYIRFAWARMLLRADQPDRAREHAALAMALAEHHDEVSQTLTHQLAARIALALDDYDQADVFADAAERADPGIPMRLFVRGRRASAAGQYEAARAAFEEAAAILARAARQLEDLHLHLGETFVHLERFTEAEEQFRRELHAFPRNTGAYSRLATMYHASNRTADVDAVLQEMVETLATPEGYETAGRLWQVFGDPSRAAALRADALSRFRSDFPSVRLEQGARR